MHSTASSSFSTRCLLTTAAVAGLSASSIVSVAPDANGTSFGTVTSGNSKCIVGDPSEYISAHDVDWIWDNRIGPNVKQSDSNWSVMDNKNWIMDHIVENQGTLNYCVRWDSKTKLAKTDAAKFEAMLTRQFKAWNKWLAGYNCWPYEEIKVNIVGFAVRDASLLDWNDDTLGKIYEGELDDNGVPKCPQSCYRFYDVGINGWSDTSACTTEPYDLSLWPKDGLDGGLGYDWGQEINLESMMQTLDNEELHIISHEIGHGFGLPDFYEKSEIPSDDFPACIMEAGRSMTVTPGDGWMLRRVLEHLKPRYNF